MQKIIRNRIRCKRCGDIIESKRTHDLVWCSCGSCAVDGGTSYLKRAWDGNVGKSEEAFEEMSVVEVDLDSVEKWEEK